MKNVNAIAEILKKQRHAEKLTQFEFSKKLGISRSYYSEIENGKTVPSIKVLKLIDQIYPIFLK